MKPSPSKLSSGNLPSHAEEGDEGEVSHLPVLKTAGDPLFSLHLSPSQFFVLDLRKHHYEES